MNEEIENLKENIRGFLDKRELETQSQYFLLLSLIDDLKDEIYEEGEDDDEPEEDDPEDDFKDFDLIPEIPKPPVKGDHSLKIKKLLKKKND